MKNSFLFLVVLISIIILGMTTFALADTSVSLTNPLGASASLTSIIDAISNFITVIASSLVVIMIVWAGILFVTSAGNPGRVKTAQQCLIWAVVGIAIVLAGKGLVLVINSVIVPPPS